MHLQAGVEEGMLLHSVAFAEKAPSSHSASHDGAQTITWMSGQHLPL